MVSSTSSDDELLIQVEGSRKRKIKKFVYKKRFYGKNKKKFNYFNRYLHLRAKRLKLSDLEQILSSDSVNCDSETTSSDHNQKRKHNQLLPKWKKKSVPPVLQKLIKDDLSELGKAEETREKAPPKVKPVCSINSLPHELLLKIFSYLPLVSLIYELPRVCQKWQALAMDWTLWKGVEDLTVKNMIIDTDTLKNLLRVIPNLKKLKLTSRNDTEEVLEELFEGNKTLEVLMLDRCYRSTLQMNILSHTITSILELCPNLRTVILNDTYFHSKSFYRSLANKFRMIERINVTCTTKSEMDVFIETLVEKIPEMEFQRVPMMGRADGKQIYWGPILGLVIRPMPTSPFHHQEGNTQYPNYTF